MLIANTLFKNYNLLLKLCDGYIFLFLYHEDKEGKLAYLLPLYHTWCDISPTISRDERNAHTHTQTHTPTHTEHSHSCILVLHAFALLSYLSIWPVSSGSCAAIKFEFFCSEH